MTVVHAEEKEPRDWGVAIGIRNAKVKVKPVSGWQMFRLIAQMPFANAGGSVAARLKPLGNR